MTVKLVGSMLSSDNMFDDTNPAGIGTATPGTAIIAGRRDHVHANPAAAITNANYLFYRSDPTGCGFTGTIASEPGGAVLTYNVVSGYEDCMCAQSEENNLAKMRLY